MLNWKLELISSILYPNFICTVHFNIFLFFLTQFVAFVDVVFGSLLCLVTFFMPLFFCVQKLPLIFTITLFCVSSFEVTLCTWVLSECMWLGLAVHSLDNMHSVLLIIKFCVLVWHFNICIYCLFKWTCYSSDLLIIL